MNPIQLTTNISHAPTCRSSRSKMQTRAQVIREDALINAQHILHSILNLAMEEVQPRSPLDKVIKQFVNTSPLFQHIENKTAAIRELIRVASNPNLDEKLQLLQTVLNNSPSPCGHLIFSDPDILHLTVLAHITKKIPDYQLATVFYKASIIRRYESTEAQEALKENPSPLQETPLFLQDGSVNPIAKNLVRQTMQPVSNFNSDERDPNQVQSHPVLTDAQLDIWFEEIRELPASEQRFLIGEIYSEGLTQLQDLLIQSQKSPADSYSAIVSQLTLPELKRPQILDAVYFHAESNIFNRITLAGNSMRMYPSVGMALTLLKVLKGQVKPVFRFGAGVSLRENGLNNQRDITLQSPYTKELIEADNYLARHDNFTSHDLLYHVIKVSYIPPTHKKLLISFADALARSREYSIDPTSIQPFIEGIEDMDTNAYEPNGIVTIKQLVSKEYHDKLPSFSFWMTIYKNLITANDRLLVSKIKEHERNNADLSQSHRQLMGVNLIFENHYLSQAPPPLQKANKFALRSVFIENPKLAAQANVSLIPLIILDTALQANESAMLGFNLEHHGIELKITHLANYAETLIGQCSDTEEKKS